VISFHRAVHRLVRDIPRGRVVTYGQIAGILGAPRAARAVGYAMRHCPPGVPWHRVVNARGAISRRPNAGGMLTQRLLLEQEGVPVRRGRILRLERHRWPGPLRARRPAASSGQARGGRRERAASGTRTMSHLELPEAPRAKAPRGRVEA
jgi:methylated-DNA-protein-cysteine methyltransferase related protein